MAVFVDAGYVFAQGSALLAGKKLARSEIILDHGVAISTFGGFASRISGLPLLRIYWYDGTSTGPTAQHLALAHLPDVKMRLGFVNSVGEQKGVDSLIVTDMIALARNHAISDAVLVSGDEDLRVGVQQAQEFGVRVHLVGIQPSRGSQSLFLLQEADTTHEWSEQEISTFLRCQPRVAPPLVSAPAAAPDPTHTGLDDHLDAHTIQIVGRLETTEVEALVEAFDRTRQVPRDIDSQLLGGGRAALGRDLDSGEKRQARERFIDECRRRLMK